LKVSDKYAEEVGGGAGRGAYYSKIKCYSLRVYSRGLTAAELAQNWAVDNTRFDII